jgi:4-hydroxybenzoyl-CoA reductase subunit beta
MYRMRPFTLEAPHTLAQAATLLAATPGARAIAGGTDLIPNMRRGLNDAPILVDLNAIAELRALMFTSAGATIGAGVTLARLATDLQVHRILPVLTEAALMVAGPGHRTAATVGGNLCLDTRCVFYNQSEWWRRSNAYCLKRGGDTCHVAPQGTHCHAAFSGDLAPALLVLGADVEVMGLRGARRLPLADLYVDDGAAHLSLGVGEILVAVHVPTQPINARVGYRKARARGAIDFPLAGVAARVEMCNGRIDDLRVALTGTNARPFLLHGTDELIGKALSDSLLAKLGKLVQKQVSPMRTTVTHANYRRQVAAVLAQRLLRELASGSVAGANT